MHYLFIYLGFVSNGEFNYFRRKGYSRPLSVFRIRSLVRAKYSRMKVAVMESMLTPKGIYLQCTCTCMCIPYATCYFLL